MPQSSRRVLVAGLLALGLWTSAPPASAENYAAELPPLPAVVTYAKSHAIPLEFDATTARASSTDSITALITLFEPKRYRQWIVQLTAVALTSTEEKLAPPAPWTMFTSTGSKFRFGADRAALALRMVGPFPSNPSPKADLPDDKTTRVLVNAEFLRLGFDHSCRSWLKIHSLLGPPSDPSRPHEFNLSAGTSPYPAKASAQQHAIAEALGVEPADEHAIAATLPSLMAFFDEAQSTPGIRDIMMELFDKSSLAWSLLVHGGRLVPSFHFDANGIKELSPRSPDSKNPGIYLFPLVVSVNEKPALQCQFVVTEPRSPLLASAGIVIAAVNSAAVPDRALAFRVLTMQKSP